MPVTIESLSAQLNQLEQQRNAAANMAQQCAGAASVVRDQLLMLQKEKEESLAANQAEAKIEKEIDCGEVNNNPEKQAA